MFQYVHEEGCQHGGEVTNGCKCMRNSLMKLLRSPSPERVHLTIVSPALLLGMPVVGVQQITMPASDEGPISKMRSALMEDIIEMHLNVEDLEDDIQAITPSIPEDNLPMNLGASAVLGRDIKGPIIFISGGKFPRMVNGEVVGVQ